MVPLTKHTHPYSLTENCNTLECKRFFEHHYSHVYFIFFDTLCSLEAGLRHKGMRKEVDNNAIFLLFTLDWFRESLIILTCHVFSCCESGPKQAKEELDSVLFIFEV